MEEIYIEKNKIKLFHLLHGESIKKMIKIKKEIKNKNTNTFLN